MIRIGHILAGVGVSLGVAGCVARRCQTGRYGAGLPSSLGGSSAIMRLEALCTVKRGQEDAERNCEQSHDRLKAAIESDKGFLRGIHCGDFERYIMARDLEKFRMVCTFPRVPGVWYSDDPLRNFSRLNAGDTAKEIFAGLSPGKADPEIVIDDSTYGDVPTTLAISTALSKTPLEPGMLLCLGLSEDRVFYPPLVEGFTPGEGAFSSSTKRVFCLRTN